MIINICLIFRIKHINPLRRLVTSSLVDLPSPLNLSYFWNFGSLLGIVLVLQLLTGLFLAINFSARVDLSFFSVSHLVRDVDYGWFFRITHANGARLFFFFLYAHISRGVYYFSYYIEETWNIGVIILFAVMGTAFLGYVLPWGQISFWGATVITGLFSVIPFIGSEVVIWLWGGFTVDNSTLTRFFSLHFMLPFLVAGIVILHLLFLHTTGSNNPLGNNRNARKVRFHPYYSFKDLIGALFALSFFFYLVFYFPWLLGDPENFIPANSLVTPIHIQPEWYFLFAYAILRSIPRKLGGAVALALSIAALFLLPFRKNLKFRGLGFYKATKVYFWFWAIRVILLTWIGSCPVEEPYVITGQLLSVFYFSYYFLFFWVCLLFDRITN